LRKERGAGIFLPKNKTFFLSLFRFLLAINAIFCYNIRIMEKVCKSIV